MSENEQALQVLHERIGYFCEAIGLYGDEEGDYRDVIFQEVAYLVEEGPDAYLKYTRILADAAERAQLDRFLDEVMKQI